MKVHVLQHVPYEGIGSIEPWLVERGATISYTRFYEEANLPDPAEWDLIIAMGGPMSVNDEAVLPWLMAEKRFLREAMAANVAVLGICLGAQLIASALGAKVYPGNQPEIGWFEIEGTPDDGSVFQFPKSAAVFHWHGETFDLPPGAKRLARSAVCENQAFQIGGNVIGLQFHLETTSASLNEMVSHGREELVEGAFVQSETAIRELAPAHLANLESLMARLLDCF